ncbi:hypothetical protein LCL95_01285 [Bacillus timonensis]|nr:hypothetical protein [Bacillus timonensis]
MKINLTKKQYKLLCEMIFNSQWMMEESDDKDKKDQMDELEQYLFSFAKDFKLEDVKYYSNMNYYSIEPDLESVLLRPIGEYEERVFFDKLAFHMAQKDLKAESQLRALTQEEQFDRLCDIEETYHEELAKNGVENVYVSKKRN